MNSTKIVEQKELLVSHTEENDTKGVKKQSNSCTTR